MLVKEATSVLLGVKGLNIYNNNLYLVIKFKFRANVISYFASRLYIFSILFTGRNRVKETNWLVCTVLCFPNHYVLVGERGWLGCI